MTLRISENHTETQVNVKGIIDRIIKYQKPETIMTLNEISILDNHKENRAFGCYTKSEGKIEIYLDSTIKWLPWILKRTYSFPFLIISMTIAHELDHHVNRDNELIDREQLAEENMLKYMYPSFWYFKPMVRIINRFFKRKIAG